MKINEDYAEARENFLSVVRIRPGWEDRDDFLGRAATVLAVTYGGLHHCLPEMSRAQIATPRLVLFPTRLGFPTWDHNALTRLVFAAHRHAIRVEIRATLDGRMIFQISPRDRSNDLLDGHPTLEAAVAMFRADYPADSDWPGKGA